MEGAGPFTVETEVLGEGLGDAEFETLFDEIADSPGVAFEVAGCKTLVCAVEEGKVLFVADDFGEFFPLVMDWVNAGGVVGAGVEKDDTTFRGFLNGGGHALEVEAFGFSGEVRVRLYGEVDVGKDLVVIRPCWRGEVDRLIVWTFIELGEKEATEMNGAGAGDGLETCNLKTVNLGTTGKGVIFGTHALLFDCRTIGAEDELLSG